MSNFLSTLFWWHETSAGNGPYINHYDRSLLLQENLSNQKKLYQIPLQLQSNDHYGMHMYLLQHLVVPVLLPVGWANGLSGLAANPSQGYVIFLGNSKWYKARNYWIQKPQQHEAFCIGSHQDTIVEASILSLDFLTVHQNKCGYSRHLPTLIRHNQMRAALEFTRT